jgi:hypothetical protein
MTGAASKIMEFSTPMIRVEDRGCRRIITDPAQSQLRESSQVGLWKTAGLLGRMAEVPDPCHSRGQATSCPSR